MTRVLSGALLIAIAVGVVWFAPPLLFSVVAEALLLLAFIEYTRLADAVGLGIPAVTSGAATLLVSIGIGSAVAIEATLMTAFVVLGALALTTWRGEREALGRVSAAIFPIVYLGLPIGALVAIRSMRGPEGLFLLMLTVIVSDTAQYYSGRMFGRTPLAATISPKKTIEGALGGFIFGTLVMAVLGHWWLSSVTWQIRALLGAATVALGIAGDLFESLLKRSAGVKDSSALIPGHGGVLDRIDALLFTAPIYYVVLKYV